MKKILVFCLVLVMIPSVVLAAVDFNSPEYQYIWKKLDMQGHADHDFDTCTVQQSFKKEIDSMFEGGKNKEQIIDYYVQEYGDSALREPSAKGANLLAWILPSAVLIVGFIGGAFMLRRMKRKPASTPPLVKKLDEFDDIIEKERKDFL